MQDGIFDTLCWVIYRGEEFWGQFNITFRIRGLSNLKLPYP